MSAAKPVLLEHGPATTTRMIADAAGIAEGTIFRVFESKDELVRAVLTEAFDPTPLLEALTAIDLEQPLAARLLEATTLLQGRFIEIFGLMTAMALPGPPPEGVVHKRRHELAHPGLIRLVEPDADRLRVPPEELVRVLRLLTFSGSHPHISDQRTLTPEQIVDIVLNGTLKTAASPSATKGEH